MRIVRALLIAATSVLILPLYRLWMRSLRTQIHVEQPTADPLRPDCDGNYIFATWHETLLLPSYIYGAAQSYTLISSSQDGEIIARILGRLGWQVIRGSSTRNAVTAVRRVLDVMNGGSRTHLTITADGPRGPRRTLKSGLVFLAAKTGMPIIPVGISYDRPLRARSWDRFAIPRPFSRAQIVLAAPIRLPADLDQSLESYRLQVEQAVARAQDQADELLATRCHRPISRSINHPRQIPAEAA